MESWSPLSEGNKGFASDHEAISHSNYSLSTSRNNGLMMMGWDLKIPSTFETTQSFGELNYPQMLGKQFSNDPIGDKVCGEEESSSKVSSSINSKKSSLSLVDLKLEGLGDNTEIVHSSKLGEGHLILSSSPESSTPSKRMRVSGLYSQTAYCQVYGCNKDLSSCKEYHKRHKVCEAHSKTSKVIVNGIEQRFCQQCSRFHFLVEFDDGKRSCRKRLAGHNERRRKPQGGLHSGRAGRLLHSYDDSRFQGNMLTTASFICQDILPSGILDPRKYNTSDDWLRRLKLEDGTRYRPLSGMPIANGNLHLKPAAFPGYDVNKHEFVPPFHVNNANILSENGSQYSSHSNFHDNTLGGEDLNTLNNTASASAGSALSLLSSHSHSSSSHAHYSLDQVSEKLNIGGGCSQPQASTSGVMSHKLLFAGMNSAAADDFGVSDGIFERSDHFVNTKDRLSDGTTINLLQLSSQLQRVEEQRRSMQVKQENDAFCLFRIT